MKITIIGLAVCLLMACAAGSASKYAPAKMPQGGIKCFKVTQTFPFRDHLGQLVRYDSFYAYIYIWQNQLLYRTSYVHIVEKRQDKMWVPDTTLLRYKDLGLTRGQPYGALYDVGAGIFNKKVPADSMLRELWVTKLGIFNGPSMLDTVLVSRNWPLKGDTTLVEEYSAKLKRDTTFKVFSTLKLWYTKPLKGCPFSFNQRLDSLRGQQVCKVYINNRIEYVMEGKPIVSVFTQHYTLQEIPVTNAAELLPLFERQKRGEYSAQAADGLNE